jgi:hypothetical protein
MIPGLLRRTDLGRRDTAWALRSFDATTSGPSLNPGGKTALRLPPGSPNRNPGVGGLFARYLNLALLDRYLNVALLDGEQRTHEPDVAVGLG